MKSRFVFAVLAAAMTTVVSSALAEESLEGKATVDATLDAKAGQVTIVLHGASEGIYVNEEYALKCSVRSREGGRVDKPELRKDDAKYESVADKPGKAKSATFTVGADKAVEGECKLVVCTTTACSSPFKVPFSSK